MTEGGRRGPLLTWLLLALLVVWLTASEAGGVLDGMRPPAEEPLGRAALTSGDPVRVETVRAQWEAWAAPAREIEDIPVAEPEDVLRNYLLLDSAFIALYGLLAAAWLFEIRDRRWGAARRHVDAVLLGAIAAGATDVVRQLEVPRRRIEESWRRWRWVRLFALALLAVVVIADGLENLAMWNAFRAGEWVGAARVAHFVRGLGFPLVTLLLVYVAVFAPVAADLRRQYETRRVTAGARVLRGLVAVRNPLLLLLALAFLLLRFEQMPDVIRRSSTIHVVTTAYLGLVLALVVWVVVAITQSQLTRTGGPRTRDRALLCAVVVVWVVVAALATAIGVGGSRAWGLWIPPAFAFVFWLAGLPLARRPAEARPQPDLFVPQELAAASAATVLVVVGLALVNATAADVMLFRRGRQNLGWLMLLIVAVPAGVLLFDRLRKARYFVFAVIVATASAPVAFAVVALRRDGGGEQLSATALFVIGTWIVAAGGWLYQLLAVGDVDDGIGSRRVLESFGVGTAGGWSRWGRLLAGTVSLALVVGVAWLIASPIRAPQQVGSVAVVLVFVAALLGVGQLATTFAARTPPPKVLFNLGIQRTPILTLLVLWIVLASALTFIQAGDFHDARLVEEGAPADLLHPAVRSAEAQRNCLDPTGTTTAARSVDSVWERWSCVQGLGSGSGVRPMFFVTAWGGGVRAAVWTASVMDCVFEPVSTMATCPTPSDANATPFARSDAIFVASGVSGGALGLVDYVAYLSRKQLALDGEPVPLGEDPRDNWVEQLVHDDFLAPALARLLLVDIPGNLAGVGGGVDDRADILERAWEAPWRVHPDRPGLLEQGMLALWRANQHIPVVLANGMSEVDDCQFVSSPLAAGIAPSARTQPAVDCISLDPFDAPGGVDGTLVATRDLADFLCDGDVRLSTMSLLAARFPFITPSGRVQRTCAAEGERTETAYVLDGGYLEDAGTMTAFQVWAAVEPQVTQWNAQGLECVVPVMLHMENGYNPKAPQPVDPDAPNEWLVPLLNARVGGLKANARTRAALEFNTPLVGPGGEGLYLVAADGQLVDRYAFVTTYAQPGPAAPLGWTLSDQALEDVQEQLGNNDRAFDIIGRWYGDAHCATLSYVNQGGELARVATALSDPAATLPVMLLDDGDWVLAERDVSGWQELTKEEARGWVEQRFSNLRPAVVIP